MMHTHFPRLTPLSKALLLHQSGRGLIRQTHTDWKLTDEFFNYTRGRFVANEAYKMAICYIKIQYE
jgi:hypothetical protein